MNIKQRFIKNLLTQYPNVATEAQLNQLISDQLLSEKIIELPNSFKSQIQNEISEYEVLKKWTAGNMQALFEEKDVYQSKNLSVCTSFDFHITTENQLKLIEINTNASFLAMGLELYKCQNLESGFSNDELIQMFKNESVLASGKKLESVCIIDEKPEEQRLFIEFLIYKSIFEKNGLTCFFADFNQLDQIEKADLIYNRYTDFYLSQPESFDLKKSFNGQKIHLSPNPYEYFLVADKQRMIDWQNQTAVKRPESLLKIYDLGIADKDEVWALRKKLFFKPKNAFGSKQAYKGASISRKTFDEFYGPTMIGQEYAQPAEIDVDGTSMKYDLRCYAYQGKLQLVIARLYQGQTTNLRTVGGGFTVVKFI